MSIDKFPDTDPRVPKTPELNGDYLATYEVKRPDIKYAVGCGDDRPLTDESRETLLDTGHESLETGAYIRYYGGEAGMARVFATVALTDGFGDTLKAMGDSFVEVMTEVRRRIEATSHVVLNLHSAESNEGSPTTFAPGSENGLGCAYAANLGVVGQICADFPDHKALSDTETTDLFGDTANSEEIRKANQTFDDLYFPDPSIVGLSREEYVEAGVPVQILKGKHAPAAETRVAINFTPDRVSNPQRATEEGKPFYNNDVTQVAEMLIRAFPELNLQPETLLRVMDSDIRATRFALAKDEGGAEALKVYRVGSPAEALKYLHKVKEEIAA